ncbi:MAG: hypothetical protein E7256_10330 [Lachnospiraceae bacterium]|nr:hypothetical protein [Lachnospiraceae bacterium]
MEQNRKENQMIRRQVSKAWFLTSKEFAVLAHARGFKSLFGFDFENLSGMKREEMYEVLYKMAAKGILKSDGTSFGVEEPYRSLMDHIASAAWAVLVYSADEERPDLCCYEEKNHYIVTEISMVQRGSLKVYRIEKENMLAFLEEGDYLPMEQEDECRNLLEENMQQDLFEPVAKVLEKDGMKCAIEVYDLRLKQESHPLIKQIRILEEGLFPVIWVQTRQKSRKFTYERKILAEEIRLKTGEELADHDIS